MHNYLIFYSNDSAFILTAFPAGGIFSGNGVVGNYFLPQNAGSGSHLITYSYTDNNGCSGSQTRQVLVNTAPQISVNTPTVSVCLGVPVQMTAYGANSYSWLPVSGLSSASGSSVTATPAGTTVYTVTGSTGGCTSSATVTLNISNNLLISAYAEKTTICRDGETNIYATGATSFQWDPPVTMISTSGDFVVAAPQQTTVYTVTGTNGPGCWDTALVTVNVYDPSLLDFSVSEAAGCAPLSVGMMFQPEPASVVGWTWNTGFTQAENITLLHETFTEPGSYMVVLVVETAYGCQALLTHPVMVYPNPVAAFRTQHEDYDLEAASVQFIDGSVNAETWYWDFGDGAVDFPGNNHLQNPVHTYTESGVFNTMLAVTNQYGCTDTAFAVVRIHEDRRIFMANAFSPNADGINDFYGPVGDFSEIQTYQFSIYDSWGGLVFETTDPEKGWDGRKAGEYCAQGVYSWVLICNNSRKALQKYTGSVTLLR